MNRQPGEITRIESNGHVSRVDVAVGDASLTAILLEEPEHPALARGKPVVGAEIEALIKANEVSLAGRDDELGL